MQIDDIEKQVNIDEKDEKANDAKLFLDVVDPIHNDTDKDHGKEGIVHWHDILFQYFLVMLLGSFFHVSSNGKYTFINFTLGWFHYFTELQISWYLIHEKKVAKRINRAVLAFVVIVPIPIIIFNAWDVFHAVAGSLSIVSDQLLAASTAIVAIQPKISKTVRRLCGALFLHLIAIYSLYNKSLIQAYFDIPRANGFIWLSIGFIAAIQVYLLQPFFIYPQASNKKMANKPLLSLSSKIKCYAFPILTSIIGSILFAFATRNPPADVWSDSEFEIYLASIVGPLFGATGIVYLVYLRYYSNNVPDC